MKSASLFLLLTLAVVAIVYAEGPNPQYFPEKVFIDRNDGNNDFVVGWYSRNLIALKEPSLLKFSQEKDSQCFRFLWLRSFHEPMSFRVSVNPDGAGLLAVKMPDGKGGYDPGNLVKDLAFQLTRRQVDEFLRRLAEARFWELPTEPPVVTDKDGTISVTLDGAQWIYEAAGNGEYHVVHRTSPGEGSYRDVGIYLLHLSRLKIKDVY